jgi:protein-S-isoprenylcysteine O-methyltransferase Ste14
MKRWTPLPPTYFWAAVLLMVGLHLLVPLKRLIRSPYIFLGIPLILVGMVLNLWADAAFKRFKTTVKPFEQSDSLITSGIFKVTRNPMYVGMAAVLVGLFIVLGSLTPVFVIPVFVVVMLVRFIIPEERDLERQFGDAFREYRKRVRRWL